LGVDHLQSFKKYLFWIIIIGVIIIGFYVWFKYFGSQEAQNKWARTRIAYVEGDYDVTYTDMNNVKIWQVRSGKVTSEGDKGYYFFWVKNSDGKMAYVQTPINRTYIEEIR
jgi:hypothetical protein